MMRLPAGKDGLDGECRDVHQVSYHLHCGHWYSFKLIINNNKRVILKGKREGERE